MKARAYHLFRQHTDCTESERTPTQLSKSVQIRAEKIHHCDVMISIYAGPVYTRNALAITEYVVHLDLVRQDWRKGSINGYLMGFDCDAQTGQDVESFPNGTCQKTVSGQPRSKVTCQSATTDLHLLRQGDE